MSEDNFKYEAQNIDPRQINIVQKRSVSVDCFLERALDPVIEKCTLLPEQNQRFQALVTKEGIMGS